jgi:phage shock protein A
LKVQEDLVGIFRRISDIISANLNDFTERFENPEKMLKQAIREMEESIGRVTEQTARAMAGETTLSRELERNRAEQQQWQQRAVKAAGAGDDSLARRALARKNEHEKIIAALDDQLAATREASRTLQRQLEAMKAKLAEARRNLTTLSARQRAAEFRKRMHCHAAGLTAEVDDRAFAKFDRLKSRVEQAEAEAEAMAKLRAQRAGASISDVEIPEPELEVAAELAEIKRKLQ